MADEYNLPIGGDITELLNKITVIKGGLGEVNDAAKQTSDQIKNSFNESAKAVENSSKAVAQSATAYKNAGNSLAQLTDALKFYKEEQFTTRDTAKIREYNTEIKKIEDEIKKLSSLGTTAFKTQQGQIERTTAALKLYRDMAAQATNPDIISKYNKKIQDTEIQIGRLSNQGKQGFDKLGNAIGNNTNFLTKGFSVLRNISYILPGIGIAGILAFASEPIFNFIKSLDIFKTTLTATEQRARALGESLAGTNYTNAIKNVSELTENIKLAKEGLLDKDKVLKQYNETIGKTTGQVSSLDEAEKALVKNGDAFIQMTLLKAAAQFALEEAAKKSFEAAQDQLNKEKEIVEGKDNKSGFLATVKQVFSKAGIQEELNTIAKNFGRGKQVDVFTQTVIAENDKKIAKVNDQKDELLKIANDFQKQAATIAKENKFNFFADDNKDAKKQLERDKLVADKRLALENEIINAQANIADESFKQKVEQEDAKYLVALNTLQKEKKDFPELVKLINQAMEAENVAHIARLLNLDKKNKEDQLKIEIEGQKAISSVLKKDSEEQIDAINVRYGEIRDKAKKAGLLTADVLKKLNEQQAKDINDITLKLLSDGLKKEEDLAISRVEIRKRKEGETEKHFELETQKAVLETRINFQEQALKIFENDPTKELEANNIRILIENLKKQLLGLNMDLANDEKFNVGKTLKKALGLDAESLAKLGLPPGIADEIAKSFSNLFNQIADSYVASLQRQLDARDEQINSLKDQIDKTQTELDRENALKEKGYANNATAKEKEVAILKAQLEKEEQDRQENIKRIKEAQKIVAEIRAAELLAQGIEQTVNLITAATKIFKATSGIPFIGVAIAIAAVATMLGTFLAIKAQVRGATNQKLEKGGTVKGKRHSEGGNKYVSMDGNDRNIIEIEEGEELVNRQAAAKHRKMIKAINAEDFSDINLSDYSLREILEGTGVSVHQEIAKQVGGDTIVKQNIYNLTKTPVTETDYLEHISKGVNKLVLMEMDKPVIYDLGTHLLVEKNNTRTRIKKQDK